MQVLIDTNVLIDWLSQRGAFSLHSSRVMEECFFGQVKAYITAHSVCDLFYILRKDFTLEKRLSFIKILTQQCTIIPEMQSDFVNVLKANCLDLEDALQMQCACKYHLDYIITRNIKDFEQSQVMAMTPEDFLKVLFHQQIH
ncbi:MAG: PIN domain-containing protein [Neisseriaceae bacterium]|nr:PIN domain-containing protein [Neisseriaceae bacterium]MBP5790265.1 PIN domain-containing protein [Neisseriaceae bacterium]